MISKKNFLAAVGFKIFFSIFWHPLLYIFFYRNYFLFVFFVLSFFIFYFFSLKILKKVLVFILNDQFNIVIIQNNKNFTFFKKINKNILFFSSCHIFLSIILFYTRRARVYKLSFCESFFLNCISGLILGVFKKI